MNRRSNAFRRRGFTDKQSPTYPNLTSVPVSSLRFVGSGSVSASGSAQVTWSALPASTTGPIRISSVDVEVSASNAAGSTSSAIQVTIYDFAGVEKVASRRIVVGNIPTRFKISNPKSTDFGIAIPADNAFSIENVTTPGSVVFTYVINYSIKSA